MHAQKRHTGGLCASPHRSHHSRFACFSLSRALTPAVLRADRRPKAVFPTPQSGTLSETRHPSETLQKEANRTAGSFFVFV